jgi:succinate-semialdehyde dehydrogenase/glutarate-semialdehyde dehydrogenase
MEKSQAMRRNRKLDRTVDKTRALRRAPTTPSAAPASIVVTSPLDGRPLGEARSWTLAEALAAVEKTRAAQRRWAKTTHRERRAILQRWLDRMNEHSGEIARALAAENGKTIHEAYVMEILPTMMLTRHFARRAEKILQPQKINLSFFKNRASYLHYVPRGVVLVIAPWNFPLAIPLGTTIMALLAGNGVILKPASLTPLIASRVRDLMVDAGLDPDLFQVVSGPGRLGSELIESGQVDFVNFTGSTAVGRHVAALAASRMIPNSMELGGKAPALVLRDADLDRAARAVVWGAFANSGQVCAAVERVYVHEKIHDEFVGRVVRLTRGLRQGNPFAEGEVDVGAMTDPAQIEIVERQLRDAKRHGAKVLIGGRRAAAGSRYFAPTILTGVTEKMTVAREETFGPVMPIMKFWTEEEAIARANDSPYGLLAYVFTRDPQRGRAVADRLEAGTVMVNEVLMTHGFPETPWAGVKQSGTGRVHSGEGLRDLCQTRHVNYEVFPMLNPLWHPYRTTVLQSLIAGTALLTKSPTVGGGLRQLAEMVRFTKRNE